MESSLKTQQFRHPFKDSVESFLGKNHVKAELSFLNEGRYLQYAFCIDQTTCTIGLQNHYSQGFSYQWIQIDYGIGVGPNKNACCLVRDMGQFLAGCNYPFRVILIPYQNGQLITLSFRSDVELLNSDAIAIFLQTGFELAELLRNEFNVSSIAQTLVS